VLWRVTEIVDEISSSEYAIDHRLSRLRWKLTSYRCPGNVSGTRGKALREQGVPPKTDALKQATPAPKFR
jgi:hypothetical protein